MWRLLVNDHDIRIPRDMVLQMMREIDTEGVRQRKAHRLVMPSTLKKLMGHIAFGACVGACVRAWVGHTFCTYCNF